MVYTKTWNDFEVFRSSARKLVIYGADNYKENLINFFKNEPILFCDKDITDIKVIEYESRKFSIISIDKLDSFKEPLDVVIFSTVYHKNIVPLIRILDTFAFDIYLYIGKENQCLHFNGNYLSYLPSMLLSNDIKNIYSEVDVPLYEYFSQIEQEQSVACDNRAIINYNQNICLIDFFGKYTNHLFGKRVTLYQPKHYNQNIHIFGDSRVYGFGVEDKFTFCSLLQKKLNDNNYKYKVINHGILRYYLEGLINKIISIKLTSADTVLLCMSFYSICKFYGMDADTLIYLILEIKNKCASYGAEFIYINLPTIYDLNKRTELENYFLRKVKKDNDRNSLITNYSNIQMKLQTVKATSLNIVDTTKYFNQPRSYSEVFSNDHHFLNSGNEIIAQVIFDIINKNKSTNIKNKQKSLVFSDFDLKYKMLLEEKYESEFLNYLNSIERHKSTIGEVIGSIVVNCSPFTNGHLKIIEYASSQVDFLYVFVTEEDSSYFSLKDRMFLVKENTKHIKNIAVNQSGQNIISKIAFLQYVDKENIKNDIVDYSNNLLIFGSEIAPALNISKRFIGSEPFCNSTRQFNKEMKETLPMYNIDVIEVGRFSVNNEYISASKVRKLFEDGKFYILRELVPEVTYNFLRNINGGRSDVYEI